ncbi:IS110 family transposase [Streptomyces sp. NPDC015661]|uniref:IS110 family transposase n=1 Tax=Streptomyces sp. NPDC015661 TaxID=3364961 RepID=UPI0037000E8F
MSFDRARAPGQGPSGGHGVEVAIDAGSEGVKAGQVVLTDGVEPVREDWARSFGVLRRAGVECTGSYGAALTRHLRAEGIEVTEVNQHDKAARRRHGKTDAIDAEAAARAVLTGRATAAAKPGDGPVEMLRLFKLAKGSAIKSRNQAINQVKSVLVSADSALRESLAGLSNPHLFKRCADLDPQRAGGPAGAARHTLRLLARRIRHLTEEVDDLNKQIAKALEVSTPGLLEVRGVGPDSAAALLISAGDNPERLVSEASFAALCGTSPVEASSGKTQRRRLNRGGDRQANAALYRIVLSRLRWDGRTRDYLQRRLTEGKTRREIIRCLKRYVAREIYRLIVPAAPPAGPTGVVGSLGWHPEGIKRPDRYFAAITLASTLIRLDQ